MINSKTLIQILHIIIFPFIIEKKQKHVNKLKLKNKLGEQNKGDEKQMHFADYRNEVKHHGRKHLEHLLQQLLLLHLLKFRDLNEKKKRYASKLLKKYYHSYRNYIFIAITVWLGRTAVSTNNAATISTAESHRSSARSISN